MTRIYIHGVLVFLVVAVLAYVVTLLVPIFDFTGNRAVAMVLAILALTIVPPIAGSLVVFVIFPLIRKRSTWAGITAWDDRLFRGMEEAKKRAHIVVVNWPSREVRTMGVLTSRFESADGGCDLVAVYIPMAQQSRLGYTHVVAVDDVEFTDWTEKQWQLFQFTYGSSSPERIVDRDAPAT